MIWKQRKIKSYDLDSDPSISAIYNKKGPDWTSWFSWFYPLLNVSLLTPAVVLTAETAVLSTYGLISINIVISIWQTNMLLHNLFYDRGNLSRHMVNLILLVGAIVLATQVALMALPLTIPSASNVIKVFFIANFISSFVNFTNTACQLALPWLQGQARSLYAWARGRTLGVIEVPAILEERSHLNDPYFLHDAALKGSVDKLSSLSLMREEEPDSQAIFHLRMRFHNLCFQYRQRKLRKFVGVLTQEAKLKKVQKLGRQVFKEGKLSVGSDPSSFFYSRMAKHQSKLSFYLKQLSQIQSLLSGINYSDASKGNSEQILQFLHAVDEAVTIDQLSSGLSSLEPDADSNNIALMLSRYVSLNGNDISNQLHQLRDISVELLSERILHYALRLHDEEGLSVDELCQQLNNRYLQKIPDMDQKQAIKFLKDIVKEHINQRLMSGETACPLAFHDCAYAK